MRFDIKTKAHFFVDDTEVTKDEWWRLLIEQQARSESVDERGLADLDMQTYES